MILACKNNECSCHYFKKHFKRLNSRDSENIALFFPSYKICQHVNILMEKLKRLLLCTYICECKDGDMCTHITYLPVYSLYVLKVASYSFIAMGHFTDK